MGFRHTTDSWVPDSRSLARSYYVSDDVFQEELERIFYDRADVLEEQDGPTLRHAIQGLHGKRISVPRKPEDRPSIELLENRYERFSDVATAP